MTEDPRCCGTGTCIINEEGLCWCGQQWNGKEMCFPQTDNAQHDSNHGTAGTPPTKGETSSGGEPL
jgi:hypothetical protein